MKLIYPPTEKIGVIVVDNFPSLGKLTALRFIEWAQNNPGGVVSLPTGKTPEHFIKWVQHYLNKWDDPSVAADLEENGVSSSRKPDMRSLHFVQIDEFYPIEPTQHNSFYYYVNEFYIKGFGLDPEKSLLIDCSAIGLPPGKRLSDIWDESGVDLSLRYRHPTDEREELQKAVIADIDQWCYEYECRIRELGGIGFFLGGIGPDGHIGFNVAGSDHNSTTRLTQTNYETQAAAATDLGGIEVARKRLVITIGLDTITHNPDCVALIIAAGEAKAKVVRDAIHEAPNVRYPATALHRLPNARFYVTKGASKLLSERAFCSLESLDSLPTETAEKITVDLALKLGKRLVDLTEEDFKNDRFGALLLKKTGRNATDIISETEASLIAKVDAGRTLKDGAVFLHTAPHHDDIMLGYLPYAVRHIRSAANKHRFAYMTSGFNAVTNSFCVGLLKQLRCFLERGAFDSLFAEGYFDPTDVTCRNRDIWQYLDGVAANSPEMKREGESRRMLRNLIAVYGDRTLNDLKCRIEKLFDYFAHQYPGQKDSKDVQTFKGMIREWEADCLWGYLGFDSESIHHMRLGFYKGDLFTEEPKIKRDVEPVLKLIEEVQPDVVTVALDPEASGPDTHYKVLQTVAEALKLYESSTGRTDIEVIGYRNVWYRFHPSEANIFVPVSLNMFAVMQNAFLNAFSSQRDASFPSYEYDGPFSVLAQQIQVQQYQMLKTCLGRRFFYEHSSPLIKATRGFVFLKKMSLQEFYTHARSLRESTERIETR